MLFIGVHGVGEDPTASNNNMGPTIFKVFNDYFRPRMTAQNPAANVGGFGVNYPKISIGQLLTQKALGGLVGDNVAEGVRALHQAVSTQVRVCPGKAIVLAGYSEGAWVIGKFLHDNSSLVGAITAVALFGDPEFDHTASRDIINGAVNGDGAARDFAIVVGGSRPVVVHPYAINPYLPSQLSGRAASWCLAEQQGQKLVHDPVCNLRLFSSAKHETVGLPDCAKGRQSCVHFHYDQAGLLAIGAGFLLAKLPPGQPPSTSTVPPPTTPTFALTQP